jgi:hypothetical protein
VNNINFQNAFEQAQLRDQETENKKEKFIRSVANDQGIWNSLGENHKKNNGILSLYKYFKDF